MKSNRISAKALDEGIAKAGTVGILSRDEYYAFLDALVTWVPLQGQKVGYLE